MPYALPSLSILFTNKTQTKSHSSLKLYTHFHRPNTLSVTPPTRQKAGGQRPVEPFATTVVIGGVWTVERRCDYGGGVLFLRQKTAAVVVDCWWFECCRGRKEIEDVDDLILWWFGFTVTDVVIRDFPTR
ncbi:hypothetical protein Hanom_Chr14g01305161 [Helianthus anomalus]